MNSELKEFLWKEWKFNTLPKYYKYFDEWINNLTESQMTFYEYVWMKKDFNTYIINYKK